MDTLERDAYIRRIWSLERRVWALRQQLWIARHLVAVVRGNARRVEREASKREWRELEHERRN